MKVLFLQSAHSEDDDRVWHHQRMTLSKAGIEADVCGVEHFQSWNARHADVYQAIIVDTPRALWKVRNTHKTQLVYDITEWYPSKKNLRGLSFPHKCAKALLLMLASLWAGARADAFIFGEQDKAKPFKHLFPHKPSLLLPYYPSLTYIYITPPKDIAKQCTLLYAGPLTSEKGWDRVKETVNIVSQRRQDVQWNMIVISPTKCKSAVFPSNVHVITYPRLPFHQFCKTMVQADIMLDLRDNDAENTRCLPIKLFYYMACGRLGIYTRLAAIDKQVPEFETAGDLVASAEQAADRICYYMAHPNEYSAKCAAARRLSADKYNWENLERDFIAFINQITH